MGCPHQRVLEISSLPYIWHSARHQKDEENRPWVLSPRNSQLCRRRKRVREQVNYRYHCLYRTTKGKGKIPIPGYCSEQERIMGMSQRVKLRLELSHNRYGGGQEDSARFCISSRMRLGAVRQRGPHRISQVVTAWLERRMQERAFRKSQGKLTGLLTGAGPY